MYDDLKQIMQEAQRRFEKSIEGKYIPTAKYKVGDIVTFHFGDNICRLTGKVEIVDKFGTFEQNDEPSYDIFVEDYNGAKTLFKHIRQSWVD